MPQRFASGLGHTDTVAFLVQLPAVKATIDHIDSNIDDEYDQVQWTTLSFASSLGRQPIVQLLLDAGADPTVPAGDESPLNTAILMHRHAIAALLRHSIDEGERARALCLALHKARSLSGAVAAALACLQGRVQQGQAMPQLRFPRRGRSGGNEKLRGTAALAAGVSDGEKDTGMCEDLYMKLQGYMLPVWADKGPEADEDSGSSEEEWGSGSDDE